MKREPIQQDSTKHEPGADWPEVDASGLDEGDKSLIRSMLERTPMERLAYLQELVDGMVALRNGRIASE